MITVRLLKPASGATISYRAEVTRAEPGYLLLRAVWERPRLELGYVTFETGDVFHEHFYADRWYNVFELRSAAGALKGWYCNVSRPARIEAGEVLAEDLALDLFVPPDRQAPLRLDLDEFAALGLEVADPPAHAAALAALDELEALARAGLPPFDRT